jgi:hypothetical protein
VVAEDRGDHRRQDAGTGEVIRDGVPSGLLFNHS